LSLSHPNCQPLPETLDAIKQADLITIGPGSLYTSIIPNLLVGDIVRAMNDTHALKVYICNIMTQPGETDGFTVEDHLRALIEYNPELELDYIVVNSAAINPSLREKYLADGAAQVRFRSSVASDRLPETVNVNARNHRKVSVVCDDLLNENDVVRHDPDRLASLLLRIHRMERVATLAIAYGELSDSAHIQPSIEKR